MSTQNIETIHRLSSLQEGLLFHSLESPKSGAYFNQFTCVLEGEVDAARLKAAWDRAVMRHSMLRSLFTWERRDQPLQVIRKRVTLPWSEADWRGRPQLEQDALWQAFLAEDRDRGFDLAQAPLMRLALLRCADLRYRMLWSFHHILLDGWSVRLIFDEVMRDYAGGGAEPPPAPKTTFADFISWLESFDLAAAEAFWTEQLADVRSATSLPAAQVMPSPAELSRRGAAQEELELSAELSDRLVAFAKASRVTLSTLMLGGWAILLSRYNDTDDVVFGVTTNGRAIDLADVESIVGPLLNTLPLRLKVGADQLLTDWLRVLQSRYAALRDFEQTPLSAIQRWSALPAGQTLFQTIVVFESFPSTKDQGKRGPGVTIADPTFIEWSNYPLALLAVPEDRLKLILVYDRRWFSEAAVHRLILHLEQLLTSMVEAHDLELGALSMMSEEERQESLVTWNKTDQDIAESRNILSFIEPWFRDRAQAVAVSSEEGDLTYGELERRAKRLARTLKALGVGRDRGVPVFMERSCDAVCAILGVLFAGGAYVPVDATYPADRVQQLLDDIAASWQDVGRSPVLLTQPSLAAQLAESEFEVVIVADDSPESHDHDKEDLPLAGPDDLAYIIHTSGSTGRPKGVMIPHRNLVNSTLARSKYYPEAMDSFLLLSSISTDSSVAGIFWALCTGARLVLPRGRQEQDVERLLALMERSKVTHTLCVPSLYRVILDHARNDRLLSLRCVMVAGEACSDDLVRRHERVLPDCAFYNEYGPTEATVWASVARLTSSRPVTIGRPIPNLRLYILDQEGRPVPIGLPGELYIGGRGVARGYLNQPAETARVFVADPFSSNNSSRLYRTGDRVRFTPEGEIEYLGRVDNQIKVRGFRVEPEEIERALADHPDVDDIVVVLSSEQSGQDRHAADVEALAAALSAMEDDEAERLIADIAPSPLPDGPLSRGGEA